MPLLALVGNHALHADHIHRHDGVVTTSFGADAIYQPMPPIVDAPDYEPFPTACQHARVAEENARHYLQGINNSWFIKWFGKPVPVPNDSDKHSYWKDISKKFTDQVHKIEQGVASVGRKGQHHVMEGMYQAGDKMKDAGESAEMSINWEAGKMVGRNKMTFEHGPPIQKFTPRPGLDNALGQPIGKYWYPKEGVKNGGEWHQQMVRNDDGTTILPGDTMINNLDMSAAQESAINARAAQISKAVDASEANRASAAAAQAVQEQQAAAQQAQVQQQQAAANPFAAFMGGGMGMQTGQPYTGAMGPIPLAFTILNPGLFKSMTQRRCPKSHSDFF